MTNRTVKSLLKENRKALQFLHNGYGMDFEKPFFIKKIEGRFTYNSVAKAIGEKLDGKYKAVLLIKPEQRWKDSFERLHVIDVKLGKFERPDRRRVKTWDFNIDEFFTVGDFEETRKNRTKAVYIIAQSNEYLKLSNCKPLNYNARYKIKTDAWDKGVNITHDGRGGKWVSKITLLSPTGERKPLIYEPFESFYYEERAELGDNIENYIDKSGYLIREKRHDLKTRAKALKAQRDLNALKAADFTEEEARIFTKLEEVKKQLSDAILKADTNEDARRIYNAGIRLKYAINYKNDYTFKSFPSIAKKQSALNFVENQINEVISALEGN